MDQHMTCGCQLLHSIGLCHSVQRHDLDGNENGGRSNILATRRREVPFEKTPKSSKCTVLCKSNASEMREFRSLFSRTFQRKFERKFGAFRAKFRLNKAR